MFFIKNEKIDNYNCEGMCIEKDVARNIQNYTYKINGMDIIFTFCNNMQEYMKHLIGLKKIH